MVLTPSKMIPLGTTAPDFTLTDAINGKSLSLNEIRGPQATVIMFICNHCPFVKHIRTKLVEVANHYQKQGIAFIAINSNEIENYPEDAPEHMKKVAQRLGYPFPYLFDETQDVAKAYKATCTPDFFIFNHDLKCIYRGQFDDSRPNNNIGVTGKDLSRALDQILAGESVFKDQKPSLGCNIKWKD
jgi:peroxiredoxin